jgi:hypothetical protein
LVGYARLRRDVYDGGWLAPGSFRLRGHECKGRETLGERESGTAPLEKAVTAYREALKETTRERAPLDWAMTQMNLGAALAALGERESGTGKLEEAVAAFNACLAVTAPVWPPKRVQYVETRRDQTQAEITRRLAK